MTKVVLAGESATDPHFLGTLRDALQEVTAVHHLEALPRPWTEAVQWRMEKQKHQGWNLTFDRDLQNQVVIDPLFAAARGAALYARWRQEAPYECVEKEECYEKRRREREGIGNEKVELK